MLRMLEVVRFQNGRYGLRNLMTGNILTKDSGAPWMYRTVWGANRRVRKLDKSFTKTFLSLRKAQDKRSN